MIIEKHVTEIENGVWLWDIMGKCELLDFRGVVAETKHTYTIAVGGHVTGEARGADGGYSNVDNVPIRFIRVYKKTKLKIWEPSF